MKDVLPQRLIEYLWPRGARGSRVHAVLDGAQDRLVSTLVAASERPHECLYRGKLSRRLRRAAPYIVQLEPDSEFTTVLIERGWGKNWGFFTVTSSREGADLTEQHKHFRRLLRVKDESDRTLLFRFYDPRVLRIYLPTCTGDEATQFFGPIQRIVVEGEKRNEVLTFTPTDTGVETKTARLQERATGAGAQGA